MTEPFVAGTLSAVPYRVHVYASRGVFSIVDENNTGCWTDPHGRVLLPTLELVDRVLKAHGYERVEMLVRRASAPAPVPNTEPEPEQADEESAPAEGEPDFNAIRTEEGLLTPEEDASLEAVLAPVMEAPVEVPALSPEPNITTKPAKRKNRSR